MEQGTDLIVNKINLISFLARLAYSQISLLS